MVLASEACRLSRYRPIAPITCRHRLRSPRQPARINHHHVLPKSGKIGREPRGMEFVPRLIIPASAIVIVRRPDREIDASRNRTRAPTDLASNSSLHYFPAKGTQCNIGTPPGWSHFVRRGTGVDGWEPPATPCCSNVPNRRAPRQSYNMPNYEINITYINKYKNKYVQGINSPILVRPKFVVCSKRIANDGHKVHYNSGEIQFGLKTNSSVKCQAHQAERT